MNFISVLDPNVKIVDHGPDEELDKKSKNPMKSRVDSQTATSWASQSVALTYEEAKAKALVGIKDVEKKYRIIPGQAAIDIPLNETDDRQSIIKSNVIRSCLHYEKKGKFITTIQQLARTRNCKWIIM